METYLTIKESREAEMTEQRSRFLSYISPAKDKEEVEAFLARIRSMHPQATHVCWAYNIGAPDNPSSYYSDDGEPSGTAGQPILQSIKHEKLDNVVLAVVRYFGGIKLGVRGLIDTYRAAAQLAVAKCQIIEEKAKTELPFSCSYQAYNTLLYKVEQMEGAIVSPTFGEKIEGVIVIPRARKQELENIIKDLTGYGPPK
ncbi:YigZ family protein [bacterium]|nr:YigZ family protein [bacterium]